MNKIKEITKEQMQLRQYIDGIADEKFKVFGDRLEARLNEVMDDRLFRCVLDRLPKHERGREEIIAKKPVVWAAPEYTDIDIFDEVYPAMALSIVRHLWNTLATEDAYVELSTLQDLCRKTIKCFNTKLNCVYSTDGDGWTIYGLSDHLWDKQNINDAAAAIHKRQKELNGQQQTTLGTVLGQV